MLTDGVDTPFAGVLFSLMSTNWTEDPNTGVGPSSTVWGSNMTWNSGVFYFETTDWQPSMEFAFVADPATDPLNGAFNGGIFGWMTLSSECKGNAVYNLSFAGFTPNPAITVTTSQTTRTVTTGTESVDLPATTEVTAAETETSTSETVTPTSTSQTETRTPTSTTAVPTCTVQAQFFYGELKCL